MAFPSAAAPASVGANIGTTANTPTSGGGARTGQTFDWQNWLNSNAGFTQLKADLQAAGVADLATLNAARQRGIIQFGESPDLSGAGGLIGGDFSSALDPTTIELASQNTKAGLSTVSRIDQQNKDVIRDIKNALAARGALQSGETGYQLDRANQGYTQTRYDATQKLVDYLAGANAAYVAAEQARKMAMSQALMSMQPPPWFGDEGYDEGGGGGTGFNRATAPSPQSQWPTSSNGTLAPATSPQGRQGGYSNTGLRVKEMLLGMGG